MSTPHTCPKCEGTKTAPNPRTGEVGACPTCNGEGVVWERTGPQEVAGPLPGDEHLDLTYRS